MENIRCLITGGAGFIGSNLVDRLLSENHEVVVLDNFDGFYEEKMQNLESSLQNPQFTLLKGDILDTELLKKSMVDVDVVFHKAALGGVRKSVLDPIKTHLVNTTGTLNVLMAAKDSEVKKVIYASSSSIYGSIDKLPQLESQQTVPLSPYGVSKLSAERYCISFYKIYGLKTVSLRYFTVYGPRQRRDMAIRIFVDQILNKNQPVIFGDGTQTRDFTNILDVVDANMLAMKNNNGDGGVFNIGSGKNISINKLIKLILKLMNSKIKPVYESKKLGDVNHTLADISKSKKILNWEIKVSLEKGLKEFIDWYKLNKKIIK